MQQVSHFAEPAKSGSTSSWTRSIAQKYNCVVTAGYLEKADDSATWPESPEYYNSAIMVDKDGGTVTNYRKSIYADAGSELPFFSGFVKGLGDVVIGTWERCGK